MFKILFYVFLCFLATKKEESGTCLTSCKFLNLPKAPLPPHPAPPFLWIWDTLIPLERSSWIMKKLYPCLKTSSVSYVSYTPSRVACLCAFVLYANLCLTYLAHLCDLGAVLMRLIYKPCEHFPRTWHTLSASLKIFLEWVCSPAKSSCFPRMIKGTTKPAVLGQKAVVKLFKWINFLSIIKTSWQFDVFLFFFSSLQTGGNKCFSLK